MVSVKWCLKQKDGLQLIESNSVMADSYIKMAEESINVLKGVEASKIWTATASYYIFYYSLYSLMLRIGVKCEIHSCSIEFMKQHLKMFYDNKDINMMEKAFSARIDLQYYANRPVNSEIIEEIKKYSKTFFIKTKDIVTILKNEQIEDVREALRKEARQLKKST